MRWILLLGAIAAIPCHAAQAQTDVPQAVLDAQQQRIASIAKAMPCSVSVFAKGGGGGGSGVLVSRDGYALTNYHVVKPCGDYMQCSLPDGELYDAVIVGIDPTGDVALIKLIGRDDFPVATIANSDQVKVGDWCFAIGNPFLLATDFQPTVTYGIVSGVHRYQYPAGTLLEYADCIQTDASINPGNSGGPLFNAAGELIGVNGRGSFEKRGRVNVGVGYAISTNQIMNFLGDLKSGRIVDHATLGASVTTNDDGRVVVTNILESSDAYRRGLRYGDQIVAFGGRAIGSTNALKNALGIYPKGWRVPITYQRQGARYDTHVRLAGVHSADELLRLVQGPAPLEDGAPKDPQKPGGKPLPIPIPHPELRPKTSDIPADIASLIKAKAGYANFYFNGLERERVWTACLKHSDLRKQSGEWRLLGEMDDGVKLDLSLGNAGILAKVAKDEYRFNADEDFDTQLSPPGSGGLLVALHVWRRLLVQTPAGFGDVYYHGTAPLRDAARYDVLVGTHKVAETRFYFAPASGELAALEMYPDTNVDPCELIFSDYRDVGGVRLPHVVEVRNGENPYATLRFHQVQIGSAKDEKS